MSGAAKVVSPMVPTVHLNGTSGKELAIQLEGAVNAIFQAREALVLAGPNARDYYPQGASAYETARQQHSERAKRLSDIQDELQTIWEGVSAQIDEAEARKTARRGGAL